MKEDITKTILANYDCLGDQNPFVDVAIKSISFGKWFGFRVFPDGTTYAIEMHDRNKFRFWHEIKDLLARRIALGDESI